MCTHFNKHPHTVKVAFWYIDTHFSLPLTPDTLRFTHTAIHYLLVQPLTWLCDQFCTQMLHIHVHHEHTHTRTQAHAHRHRAGINQNFDPNTNCRPSSISCWFVISLLCKVCSFTLKQDFPCCERVSDTVRVIPMRGNQFGVHPPIFHSCPLYSSPLISPFIIFTCTLQLSLILTPLYLQFPLLSLVFCRTLPLLLSTLNSECVTVC